MEQSTTYQAIVRRGREEGRVEGRVEGRAEEARNLVLLLGQKKFGPPDPEIREALNCTTDVTQLENLGVRLLSAGSWQELLASGPRRRKRGRGTGD